MADRRAYGAAGNFPKSAETVDEWLDAIQMGMYKMNFAKIAVPDLPALSNSQLKEMVPQDGHRKRMTLAIAALEGLSRDAAAASAASAAPQVKFNSTSSFYIDSTISKPCIDEIIFCVSIVIHDRIEEGEANPAKDAAEGSKLFPFFDVQSKPLFQFADGDGGPRRRVRHARDGDGPPAVERVGDGRRGQAPPQGHEGPGAGAVLGQEERARAGRAHHLAGRADDARRGDGHDGANRKSFHGADYERAGVRAAFRLESRRIASRLRVVPTRTSGGHLLVGGRG